MAVVLFLSLLSISPLLPGSSLASLPTREEYIVYRELENQLLTGDDASFKLYRLSETFYPKVGPSPICVPITYILTCPNETIIDNCTSHPIPCSETEAEGYRASYLWSQYDLSTAIAPVLLSYAWNGIRLEGFSWEDSCDVEGGLEFVLDIDNISCRSGDVIKDALKALTAVAKVYAKNGGKPAVGDSEPKGYAVEWSHQDREADIYHASHYTLTFMMVVLNLFIFLIASAMTAFTYDAVYNSILHKRNPNYPIFWSFVVLTFIWNIGPSWLVLSRKSNLINYSLIFMVPLELLVAILIKKKSDFPIPLLAPRGCSKHVGYFFTFDRTIITACIYCIVSHVAQTLAIWTILIFLTFLSYYAVAIIVAFYLYPTQVLVKVVFLKAVALCTILNVALLFSNSKFKCGCTWKSIKEDLGYFVRVLAIASFLPILAFLAFVIGGILFTRTQQTSGLQSIITLLPSLFLVFAAWFTKGTLFPPGTDEPDLESQVINELETGGGGGGGGGGSGGDTHSHNTPPTKTKYSSTGVTPRKSSSPHSSLRSHSNTPDTGTRGDDQDTNGEKKPLLH